MNCSTVGSWVDALLDGELDPKNAAEVEAHLEACPECKQRYEAKRALSSNMRRLDLGYAAPESLRRRITAGLEAAQADSMEPGSTRAPSVSAASGQRAATRGPARWFVLAGWPVALAASALLASVLLQQRSQEADEVVAAHVRSLLADHLNDVVSSSHHTVKPWFAGKINFAPPVPDLASQGFELVGGRLDYLEHQQVAALVYRKHGHIINVLASLPGRDTASLPQTARVQGYSLRSWKQAGLNLVAVSDIDPVELANLEQGFEKPVAAGGEPAGNP
jgi:mycothiol system anti-sigma-R factor